MLKVKKNGDETKKPRMYIEARFPTQRRFHPGKPYSKPLEYCGLKYINKFK